MIKRSLLLASLVLVAGASLAQQPEERGLVFHKPGAYEGLNLFAPLDAGTTYLMDNDGRLIHTWESEYRPSSVPYLLPNGNLLRPVGFGLAGNGTFRGGGAGYGIEEYTWDGEKTWEFIYSNDEHLMHHDVEPLPNGNVLILAWEMKTKEEAIAAGRNPELLRDGELWSEHIIEVKPVRPEGAEIVWEWHLWDHLVQDFDETKDNYGDVGAHPELVDIDPPGSWMDRISPEELERLEALGYLTAEDKEKQSQPNSRSGQADWLHINAIAYNSDHDLIALSVLGNNELWVLDHSTTTEEAKGHSGGRYGKGGDILYRWGNPLTYRMGGESDQKLFAQHDVHWIAEGLPGEGDILIFNNGRSRPDGNYSSVVQITPPFTKDGGFHRADGKPWGPAAPVWEYTAPEKKEFYSFFISGARRLPNGNTLICAGSSGTFFEVTPENEEVWRYMNAATAIRSGGDGEGSGRGGGSFLRNVVFRVYRYPFDYPAFEGRDLASGPVLTEYLLDHPAKTPMDREDGEES